MRPHRLARALSVPVVAVLAAAAALGAAVFGAAPPAAAEVVSPLHLRYEHAVYGDMLTVGNAVLDCPAGPAADAARCKAAMRGENNDNNNQFVMTRPNEAALAGTFDSSAAEVTVPAGATVAHARLFWGGNTGKYKSALGSTLLDRCEVSGKDVDPAPGSPSGTSPKISVDGAAATPVAPKHYATSATSANGPHYYTAEGDVTGLFAGARTGTPLSIEVGDVWAPSGMGCVGGWSIVVVYKFDAPNKVAPILRHVYVYGGHVLQRSRDAATTVDIEGFYRYGTAPVHASVTAHEGDRAATGDTFLINKVNVPNPHTGATNNFFIGLADTEQHAEEVGSPYNLGTDVDNFDVPAKAIPTGATSAKLTTRTSGDTYVLQEVALSVPVPDLRITKKSPSGKVRLGDTVEYQVTVENLSDVAHPAASFTDDMTDVLDDATWVSATASAGTATYTEPELTWTGEVPAGGTVAVTYRLKINDPASGDGKLLNNVVTDDDRASCAAGSGDPGCGGAIEIDEPGSGAHPGHPTQPGGPGHGDATGPDGLAVTGTKTLWPLTILGAVLVAIGAAALFVSARRRRD